MHYIYLFHREEVINIHTSVQFVEDEGYEETVLVVYMKIIFGSIAVACAVYSHFNKWTYPDNYRLIVTCVAIYGVCALILQVSNYFLEGSNFYCGKIAAKVKRVRKETSYTSDTLYLSSVLSDKHGSSIYKLSITSQVRGTSDKKNEVVLAKGYENYLTSEGNFLVDTFRKDFRDSLNKFHTSVKKSASKKNN